MFTHVMVGANDPEKARKFYDATMGALEHQPSQSPPGADRHFYGSFQGGAFGVGKPANGDAAQHANGGTISFSAQSPQQVDAWHKAGLEQGGSCEGPPGVREQAPGKPYGAYLRDPDGNKLACFSQNSGGR